jgi:predicted Zn-dependent peptidase
VLLTTSLPRGASLAAELAEGARAFAAGFWFPFGSRHEAPHERGFVHFMEHMVFKGTSRRSAAELSREVDRVGGFLNAFTDRDSICLHCLVPASHWRLAIDVLADMAFGSTFPEEDFLRERSVIASEIASAADDPEECAHDEFLSRIWPGDPLARKIAGEREDLERITRDSLFAFYEAAFAPASLLVTAAGPVPPAEVAFELERVLGAFRGRESPAIAWPASSTPSFRATRSYVAAPMEQVHYFEAVQLDPPFVELDYFAMAALNGVLGEASSSRLFLRLREQAGLCYSIYSAFAMTRSECLWMAAANVSAKRLAKLGASLSEELERAAGEALGEAECADAVTRLSGIFEVALDDADYRMRRLGRQVLFSASAVGAEETRTRIAALGAGEINAMRERLLRGRVRARFAYGRGSRSAAKALGLEEKGRG